MKNLPDLSSYKAIFFDAGGTLLHPFPSVGHIYAEVARRYGSQAEAAALEALFRTAWLKRDGLNALISHSSEKVEKDWWYSLVKDVFEQTGAIEEFDLFFDELYVLFGSPEVWRLYSGVHDLLRELQRQKKILGIISNWDSRLFQLCDGLGLTGYFDFIVASAVFGAAKPSPRIFTEALRRAGVEPHEALHIGDSLEDDVRGARHVGIDAVLINRHLERHTVHGEQLTDIHVIHDLSELNLQRPLKDH